MIVDGHTGAQHSVPVATLYEDVLHLWSQSEPGYTPTLVVAYGGPPASPTDTREPRFTGPADAPILIDRARPSGLRCSFGGSVMANPKSQAFWPKLRTLVSDCAFVVDRPKGSEHPRLPGVRYPYHYGHLEGTTASDGEALDAWRGSGDAGELSAVICTVDLGKRDMSSSCCSGVPTVTPRPRRRRCLSGSTAAHNLTHRKRDRLSRPGEESISRPGGAEPFHGKHAGTPSETGVASASAPEATPRRRGWRPNGA